MYERAKRGIIVKGETKNKLIDLIEEARHAINLNRLIILLSILSTLAESDEYELITSAGTLYKFNSLDTDRINKICTYTLTNYKKEISLSEIASISNLSVTSFCRYFKQMTKKTYYDFLTEIRISHACRMLVEDKMTVEGVYVECGFNNASNFYKHFKKIMDITPLDYKKRYLYP